MRKILMTSGLVLLLMTGVYGRNITLNINDQVVATSVAPIQEDGVTLVPLRIISENLGAQVGWDGPSKTVTINQDQTQIKLVINQKTVTVNGAKKELLLAPKLKGATTMVPLRFISENLGAYVDWNAQTATVFVKSQAGGKPGKAESYFKEISLATKDGKQIVYKGNVILVDGVEVPDGKGTLSVDGKTFTGDVELVGNLTNGTINVKLPGGISGAMKIKDGKPHGKVQVSLLGGKPMEIDIMDLADFF